MSVEAGIAEPEKIAAAREWLCKHVSMATNSRDHSMRYTNITIEELLEPVFSVRSMPTLHEETVWT
jgi:hypothetical protein